jgi:hypothetical protein
MIGIAHQLFFEHIDRHLAGLSCTQSGDKDMFRLNLRRARQLRDLCQFGCSQRQHSGILLADRGNND